MSQGGVAETCTGVGITGCFFFILKIVKVEVPGLAKEDKEQVAEEW